MNLNLIVVLLTSLAPAAALAADVGGDNDLSLNFGELSRSVEESRARSERSSIRFIEIRSIDDQSVLGLIPLPEEDFHHEGIEAEIGSKAFGGSLNLVLSNHLFTQRRGSVQVPRQSGYDVINEHSNGHGVGHTSHGNGHGYGHVEGVEHVDTSGVDTLDLDNLSLRRQRAEVEWTSPLNNGWYYRFGGAVTKDRVSGSTIENDTPELHSHGCNEQYAWPRYKTTKTSDSDLRASLTTGGGREVTNGRLSASIDAGVEVDTCRSASNLNAAVEAALLGSDRRKLLVTAFDVKAYEDGTCDINVTVGANANLRLNGRCATIGVGVIFPLERSDTQYGGLRDDSHAPAAVLSLTLGRK